MLRDAVTAAPLTRTSWDPGFNEAVTGARPYERPSMWTSPNGITTTVKTARACAVLLDATGAGSSADVDSAGVVSRPASFGNPSIFSGGRASIRTGPAWGSPRVSSAFASAGGRGTRVSAVSHCVRPHAHPNSVTASRSPQPASADAVERAGSGALRVTGLQSALGAAVRVSAMATASPAAFFAATGRSRVPSPPPPARKAPSVSRAATAWRTRSESLRRAF